MTAPVALVMGAGDAIGSAIVRRLAAEGFVVCAARRHGDALTDLISELTGLGQRAYAYSCDAREEEQVQALFAEIETELGPLELVIFNVGANVPMTLVETSARKFRKIWEMACYGGFLVGREAARRMTERRNGTIIFTGATASTRGAAGFGAFASAKHGLKALAQSMARELGPQRVHVAHVVIDAAVDTAWIQEMLPNYPALMDQDGIVLPQDLAETYLMLHRQPANAWTFEIDVRPWVETW